MKVGDNNVIESKGELRLSLFCPEFLLLEQQHVAPSRVALTGTLLSAFVGRNVILTSGCIIGACCNVNTYEVIPENTVIYGADCLRRVQTERPQVGAVPLAPGSPHGCPLLTVLLLSAPDTAARLPDENPAQLPSPEEDDEGCIHTC